MKILFIGDIVGKTGRTSVKEVLPFLFKKERIDYTIANCENLAHGNGITEETIKEMREAGVKCFTSGNHIFDKRPALDFIEDYPDVLRPLNYPPSVPGNTYRIERLPENKTLLITNLLGRAFMPPIDCPFRTLERLLEEKKADYVFVDFHAEATAEKAAFANYFDGRVDVVVGTHTHVQTADERMLPKGTLFITDVGMCGASDSIIGVKKEAAIKRMITGLPQRFEPAGGDWWFSAVLITLSENERSIKRIFFKSKKEFEQWRLKN